MHISEAMSGSALYSETWLGYGLQPFVRETSEVIDDDKHSCPGLLQRLQGRIKAPSIVANNV